MRNLLIITSLFLLGLSIGVLFSSLRGSRVGAIHESPASVSRLGGTIQITPNSPELVTLLFAGDVMLGRSVNTRIKKYQDINWPFLKVTSLLQNADLTLVNLESPFATGCKPTDAGMIFCADPSSVTGLKNAGIDIVNLANNHIDNQGQKGIEETSSLLTSAGIGFVGLNQPYIKTVKNMKIAFLGFTDVGPNRLEIAQADAKNLQEQISAAKKQADLVITTFHWGNEYSQESDHQKELARLAIDSGADAVIGHHPHWVQGQEIYKDKPIYYSLGNLVFDQMWSDKTRNGLVVKLIFSGTKLVGRQEARIRIFDYGQPSLEQ